MDQTKKDDAQAQFAKTQRAEDGRRAMLEYEQAALATRLKTERLRALRLARDAELAKTAPPKAAKKKATKSGKSASAAASAAAGTLSDWLEGQQRGGHRS